MAKNRMRIDPTRTGLLRRAFEADMGRRFAQLKKALWQLVVKDNALELDGPTTNADNPIFSFRTSAQKLQAFHRWLGKQVRDHVMSTDHMGRPWLAKYIESSYKKGLIRSYTTKHAQSLSQQAGFYDGTVKQFLRSSFDAPERTSKVELLATRVYEDLRGISAATSQKVGRVLADGMVAGKNPLDIARTMSKTIDTITRTRAKVLARTEVIHAHAEGQLDAFEDLGVKQLTAMAEWLTAGDEDVCPECEELEGAVMTVAEARGLIPRHPNCVAGGSFIQSSDAMSLMKVRYTGPVVEIRTAVGRVLSVTENHILLTQRGWVAAKDIRNTDYLVDASTVDRRFGQSPNYDKGVACIAYVFATLSKRPGVLTYAVPSTPEDLHGDGKSVQGKIKVVCLDGLLGDESQSGFGGNAMERRLVFPLWLSHSGMTLPRRRSVAQLLKRIATASDRFMCRQGVVGMLASRSLFHHYAIGFGLPSSRHASILQSPSNSTAAGAILVGNTVLTPAPLVQRHNGINRQIDTNAAVLQGNGLALPGQQVDSGMLESSGDEVLPDVKQARDFCRTLPFPVQLDKVVSVNVAMHMDLPMYDVSTASTMYILNGVLSSNCRCAWMPANVGEGDEEVADQKWGADKKDAIRSSIQMEKPDKPYRQAKAKSTWAGKGLVRNVAAGSAWHR